MAALDGIGAFVERADSPLGSWLSARWQPPNASPLHGLVERIWYFDGALTHPRERAFPDGLAELIVMLDERHRDGDTDALAPFPAVCINGIRSRPSVVVAPAGRCRVLGVRLNPSGACRLLREPMNGLVDVTIDLQQSLGRAAAVLGERCSDAAETYDRTSARSAAAILQTAVGWLTAQFDVRPETDPTVRWMENVIRGSHGVVSVDDIAVQLSMRRSQLARRFKDAVGVAPKRFARIVRFHHALSALGQGESIAAVAADLHYFDQAHLYRDFADFAGMTPGGFAAAARYPGGVNLAEA